MFTNLVLRAIGSAATGRGPSAKLSILIYHRVLAKPDPILGDEVDADVFRTHMDALAQTFNVLPLIDGVRMLRDGTLPSRAVSITFDDGYANNASVALPILVERSLPACFFVSTAFVNGECMWNDIVIESIRNTLVPELDLTDAGLGRHRLFDTESRRMVIDALLPAVKRTTPDQRQQVVDTIVERCDVEKPMGLMMSPSQIRSLSDAGMDVGGHTITHPLLSSLTMDQAIDEIEGGRKQLADITGRPIRLFAYPNGKPGHDFNEEHVELLGRLGFEAAVTTVKGTATRDTNPFLLPRFTPWDRSKSRFSARLIHNAMTRD